MRRWIDKQQHIVVRGLLIESDRVLIMRRAMQYAPVEYYELPGGYLQFGEDPIEALRDVFFTQTRIRIHVGEPFQTISRISPQDNTHTIEIVYSVRPDHGISFEGQLPDDHLLWVAADEAGYFLSSHISETIRAGFKKFL